MLVQGPLYIHQREYLVQLITRFWKLLKNVEVKMDSIKLELTQVSSKKVLPHYSSQYFHSVVEADIRSYLMD